MQQRGGRVLESVLAEILKNNLPTDVLAWLNEKASLIREEKNAIQLNLSFATVPRKTGHKQVVVSDRGQNQLKEIHADFIINHWSIDRACRVWAVLQVDPSDKSNYFSKLENLFKASEMNEAVALYSAFTGFSYPEDWQKQCAEGIRSNIGTVLEAIMYNNPYPYKYLSEAAWNQLIMKAFFTDKDVKRIIGLDERANKELARILIDYADERRAAHRDVNPQLWRLVSKFVGDDNFSSIEKAFRSTVEAERKAVALACFYSSYPPAKKLLETDATLKSAVEANNINWTTL
jgi:hypothetical protein